MSAKYRLWGASRNSAFVYPTDHDQYLDLRAHRLQGHKAPITTIIPLKITVPPTPLKSSMYAWNTGDDRRRKTTKVDNQRYEHKSGKYNRGKKFKTRDA